MFFLAVCCVSKQTEENMSAGYIFRLCHGIAYQYVSCNMDACAVPCLLQTGVSAALCAEILVNIVLKLALLPFFNTSFKSQS